MVSGSTSAIAYSSFAEERAKEEVTLFTLAPFRVNEAPRSLMAGTNGRRYRIEACEDHRRVPDQGSGPAA